MSKRTAVTTEYHRATGDTSVLIDGEYLGHYLEANGKYIVYNCVGMPLGSFPTRMEAESRILREQI